MHTLPDVWTIVVDDSTWPHTDPDFRKVFVPSGFSEVKFGAWSTGSRRKWYQNWLVLAHEMCGHARLMAHARLLAPGRPQPHPSMEEVGGGQPGHDPIVAIENQIAIEQGISPADLRGLFADPHRGESFARIVIAGFPLGSADVAALPRAEAAKLAIADGFMYYHPDYVVKADVVGHTDQLGTDEINNPLSLKRAENVKEVLVKGHGIPPARFIGLRGVGRAECRRGGSQPACRKVELFMYVWPGASITPP